MPATLTYPGVYIQETRRGSRTITGVATARSAAFWAGRARARRPAGGDPGFAHYERTSRALSRDAVMGYAVRHFFLNGGGDAVIVRRPPRRRGRGRHSDGCGLAGGVGALRHGARARGEVEAATDPERESRHRSAARRRGRRSTSPCGARSREPSRVAERDAILEPSRGASASPRSITAARWNPARATSGRARLCRDTGVPGAAAYTSAGGNAGHATSAATSRLPIRELEATRPGIYALLKAPTSSPSSACRPRRRRAARSTTCGTRR